MVIWAAKNKDASQLAPTISLARQFIQDHVAVMRHMVVIVPELTGYASIRHVAVSLPYAAQLIDG